MEDSDSNHLIVSSGGDDGGMEAVQSEQLSDDSGDGLHREDPDPPVEEMSEPPGDEVEEHYSYTCPICLCELAVIRNEGSDSEETNETGDPIFTLSACQHKYCLPCLHEYVKSKLVEGNLEISCCHFRPTATDEKEVDICNIAIARCDIKRLIHMDYFRRNSYASDWISDKKGKSTAQDANKSASNELWAKFKKLEFDRLHGKDAVRRCPACDEAALFDVDAMKRHQTEFESIPTESATSNSAPAGASSNNISGLDRFFRRIRQTQDSNNTATTTTTTTADNTSNNAEENPADNTSNNAEENPADKEDEEQPAVLEPKGDLHSEEVADVQIAEKNSLVKSKSPVITCGSCSTEFCYFHSNAHQGQSCLAYHAATSEADRTNAEFATRVLRVKPCPNCGISVSKEGGCNQMKCSSCNTHFCWLCSAIIDDGPFPDHFRWWNINGCPNMQLDESTEPRRCTLVGARVLSVLQLLILGVPAVALSIVSMLICPCMVPGCGSNMRERVINCVSFYGSCLSTLIMLPFTLLGMLLVACLYCFVAAISCCVKIPKNNDAASGQRGNQTVRRTGPAANVTAQQPSTELTSTAELIRELENIFGRLEEGSLREGAERASAARNFESARLDLLANG
eukprot:scaffold903_cov123-Skeletonema_dohrnii-CCMP3373.AAC.2